MTRGLNLAGVLGLLTGQIIPNTEVSHKGKTLHLGPQQPRLPYTLTAKAGHGNAVKHMPCTTVLLDIGFLKLGICLLAPTGLQ